MTVLKEKQLATTIIETALARNVQGKDRLMALKRELAKGTGLPLPSTAALREAYLAKVEKEPTLKNATLERTLVRREIRSLSGVAVVTVLTKPYPCPGKCIYCPSEVRMPKSYLSNEPAAARALAHEFDPYAQVIARLTQLTRNGHTADKIELIVKGGTWSAYEWDYRQWFIQRCFDACNAFMSDHAGESSSLQDAQTVNETAEYRIIGLTLETRPDRITPTEVMRLRELGCTRIELGVQSVDDRILAASGRGHDADAVARATRVLKDTGYKCDFHMMPQLPEATPESDLEQIITIFDDERFRPDMVKIYPCVVLEGTELYDMYRRGEYTPYPDNDLIEMLVTAKQHIPRYCRIPRLIRDIPSTSVIAGNAVTNLRQTIHAIMRARGVSCACLRCREIGHAMQHTPELKRYAPKLFDDIYTASGGTEHFLSFEDRDRRAVFAFCRMRLPSRDAHPETAALQDAMPEIKGAAFLRELHTYGHLVPINTQDPDAAQHKGLGKKLMAEAERIAKDAGYTKMAVISGVGVRGYYKKLGYELQGTYMVKNIKV